MCCRYIRSNEAATYVAGDDGGHVALDKVVRLLEDGLDDGDPRERANERPQPDDVVCSLREWAAAVSEPPANVRREACKSIRGRHGDERIWASVVQGVEAVIYNASMSGAWRAPDGEKQVWVELTCMVRCHEQLANSAEQSPSTLRLFLAPRQFPVNPAPCPSLG